MNSISIHTKIDTYHAEIDNPHSTARLIILLPGSDETGVKRFWFAGDEYSGNQNLPVYAQQLLLRAGINS